MAEIRNDIFPNMLPYIGDEQRFFELWNIPKENQEVFLEDYIKKCRQDKLMVFVNEVYQGIFSQFQSERDLVDYINSLLDVQTAELFIEVCKFYFVAKKYQTASYVKLIMMLSIIEKTISKEKEWEEFHSWIFNQHTIIQNSLAKIQNIDHKSFLKIINELKELYFNEYGSQRNVVDFFRKYITTENQVKLVKSFRANYVKAIEELDVQDELLSPFPQTIEEASEITKKPIENIMMPYCFNWKKCLIVYGDCEHSETCELNNASLLDETLKKVVKDIYQIRNDFVHLASITPLNEYEDADAKYSFSTVISVIGSKYKPINIDITIKEFESIFEHAIKRYFDNYVKKI